MPSLAVGAYAGTDEPRDVLVFAGASRPAIPAASLVNDASAPLASARTDDDDVLSAPVTVSVACDSNLGAVGETAAVVLVTVDPAVSTVRVTADRAVSTVRVTVDRAVSIVDVTAVSVMLVTVLVVSVTVLVV